MHDDDRRLARHRVCAVIDDDASVCDSLGVLLETHGFEARLYGSGQEFLTAPDRHVDFVIVDQHMPGMDGIDLIEALRRQGFSVPAVLISGRLDATIGQRAKRLGVPVLEKPFLASKLLELMGTDKRRGC